MIQREIEIFDKKNEELVSIVDVFIPDDVLFNYYKDYTEEMMNWKMLKQFPPL